MYLGIDYGTKRIGLALAEPAGPAAPWKIIDKTSVKALLRQLKEIVEAQKVDLIVIGRPLSLQGKETEMTFLVDSFVRKLFDYIGIKVVTEDERLTSSLVSRAIGQGTGIDDKSAAVILQSFIDKSNAGS